PLVSLVIHQSRSALVGGKSSNTSRRTMRPTATDEVSPASAYTHHSCDSTQTVLSLVPAVRAGQQVQHVQIHPGGQRRAQAPLGHRDLDRPALTTQLMAGMHHRVEAVRGLPLPRNPLHELGLQVLVAADHVGAPLLEQGENWLCTDELALP